METSGWKFVVSYQIAEEGIWKGPNPELLLVSRSLGEIVLRISRLSDPRQDG